MDHRPDAGEHSAAVVADDVGPLAVLTGKLRTEPALLGITVDRKMGQEEGRGCEQEPCKRDQQATPGAQAVGVTNRVEEEKSEQDKA